MAITNLTVTSAPKNYIGNYKLDVDTTGYSTYANGAAIPTNGTGGTPTLTFTTSATSPLRGAKSGIITPGALGNGVSYAFTIDAADEGKGFAITFDYAISSGTMVTGDYVVYVYDVTNSQMIQPYGYQLPSVTSGQYLGTFTSNANSASYRLIIHQAVASTATLKIDNVSVSTQIAIQGMAGSDWKSDQTFVPNNFGVVSVNSLYYQRVGDSMHVRGYFTPGTAAAATASISLPSGFNLDSSKMSATANSTFLGIYIDGASVNASFFSSAGQSGAIFYDGSDTSKVYFGHLVGSGPFVKDNASAIANASQPMLVDFTVPIAGWSSNVTMAQSSTFKISSYLANGTRVTATPTALGQYRSYVRAASANTYTDSAPTVAPNVSDGIKLMSSGAYGTADTTGNISRYEIFVGKNKNIKTEFYASTGRTGYVDTSVWNYSTNSSNGTQKNYDPTTGILEVVVYNDGVGTSSMNLGTINQGFNSVSTAYFDVVVSENALAVGVQAPRSEVWLTQGNGHGSTNTKIRRFVNLDKNIGNDITYTDDAALGASLKINSDGVYAITYMDYATASTAIYGMSVNTTQPTISITGITRSNILALVVALSTFRTPVSVTTNLKAGDVIRPHDDGNLNDTDPTYNYFKIVKVSN